MAKLLAYKKSLSVILKKIKEGEDAVLMYVI